MPQYNVFAQNGISVDDTKVKEMFRLHARGASLNWELLHKAKQDALDRFPEEAEQILEDFETEMYWTKKKLAKKGLLHETSEYADEYDDSFEEDELYDEDESPEFRD